MLAFDDPRHGTYGAYTNHACRCDRCTAAITEHHRDLRARHARERTCGTCGGGGGSCQVYARDQCNACYRYQWRTGRPRRAAQP